MENLQVKRGRKHTFGNEKKNYPAIAKALIEIGNDDGPSVFHLKQLIETGFVDVSKGEKAKEGRGRRPYVYTVSEKGKRLLGIAKNVWGIGQPLAITKQ